MVNEGLTLLGQARNERRIDVYVSVSYRKVSRVKETPMTVQEFSGNGLSPHDKDGETDQETFTITQLAAEFDVSLRALRFYEDKKLLSPARRGQQRVYSRRDRARLKLILRGKRLGFSLSDIKEMLDLYDLRDNQESQLRVSLDKFRERIVALTSQRQDIDEAIEELENACVLVETLLEEKSGKEDTVNVIGFSVAQASRAD